MTPQALLVPQFNPSEGQIVMLCEHLASKRPMKMQEFGFIQNPPPALFGGKAEAHWGVVCKACGVSQTAPRFIRAIWKNGEAVVHLEQRRIYG